MSDRTYPSALRARFIAALWRLLSRARPITLWRLARRLGPLVYRFSARERKVTDINLREVYPQFDEARRTRLARDSIRHSTATMLELGFAWMANPARVEASIQAVHGRELLDEARAEGRGVIVLAPHFGNWEVLNFWLSGHFPFTAMYEPPKIAELDSLIRQGRERMGAALVPTNSRGVASLLKALKRSEAVGILPDQEPDWRGGVFADFFHRPAYTGTLLPKLVARTQARVVTGVARRAGRRRPAGGASRFTFSPCLLARLRSRRGDRRARRQCQRRGGDCPRPGAVPVGIQALPQDPRRAAAAQ